MPPLNQLQKTSLAVVMSQLIAHDSLAAAISVNSIDDSLDTVTGTNCTLRKAIESFNTGSIRPGCVNTGTQGVDDTITFEPGLNGETITLVGSQLTIGHADKAISLTIQGSNITIDGDLKSRVMQVQTGDSLTMDAVTITRGSTLGNGDDNSNGAGIELLAGGALHLTNATVSHNSARRRGGGIAATSSNGEPMPTVTLQNSLVTQNVSRLNVGAGLHFSRAELMALNTVISENTASGDTASGGGAYLRDGQFEFDKVSIIGNTSGTAGGRTSSGAGLSFSEGNLVVRNSTIANNRTYFSGAGLSIRTYAGDSVTISNSTISGNTAAGKELAQAGAATFFGGGGQVTIRNSTIADNLARNGDGSYSESFLLGRFSGITIELFNTIIASRAGAPACNIVSGSLLADSDNLVQGSGCGTNARNINPRLGALADNGGPTLTHLPLPNSPAANTGNNAQCEAKDQRGETRQRNAANRCDVGAVETEIQPSLFVIPIPGKKAVVFEL